MFVLIDLSGNFFQSQRLKSPISTAVPHTNGPTGQTECLSRCVTARFFPPLTLLIEGSIFVGLFLQSLQLGVILMSMFNVVRFCSIASTQMDLRVKKVSDLRCGSLFSPV